MDADSIEIRPATSDDATGVHAIYAPIVAQTVISFEVDVPPVDEMRRRIEHTIPRLPWLVAATPDSGGGVAGYAYAAEHQARQAYRWSVNVSVYLAEEARRQGLGRRLYGELFSALRGLGYVSAFAGITLPNQASVGLHQAMGFEPIGTFPTVGFKLGGWHEVGWWRLSLTDPPAEPQEPMAWRFGESPR